MMSAKIGYSKPPLNKDILKYRLWRHNYVNEELESYGENISKGGGWLREIEQFWVMGNNDKLIFRGMSFLGRI